jgi:hypothetical protein
VTTDLERISYAVAVALVALVAVLVVLWGKR